MRRVFASARSSSPYANSSAVRALYTTDTAHCSPRASASCSIARSGAMPGAAGDEQEVPLARLFREAGTCRPDPRRRHAHPGRDAREVRARRSRRVESDQQFERAALACFVRRERQRVRPPHGLAASADEHRLPGAVVEHGPGEIQLHDQGARCGMRHVADAECQHRGHGRPARTLPACRTGSSVAALGRRRVRSILANRGGPAGGSSSVERGVRGPAFGGPCPRTCGGRQWRAALRRCRRRSGTMPSRSCRRAPAPVPGVASKCRSSSTLLQLEPLELRGFGAAPGEHDDELVAGIAHAAVVRAGWRRASRAPRRAARDPRRGARSGR